MPNNQADRDDHLDDSSGGGGGGRGGAADARRKPFGKGAAGSIRSRTTAGLTTFEDDLDSGFGSSGRPGLGGGGGHQDGSSSASHGGFSQHHHGGGGGPSPFTDSPGYDSEFSDDDSLGSMLSGDSPRSRSSVPDSEAGQIWGMLCSLDDLVLEVKVRS